MASGVLGVASVSVYEFYIALTENTNPFISTIVGSVVGMGYGIGGGLFLGFATSPILCSSNADNYNNRLNDPEINLINKRYNDYLDKLPKKKNKLGFVVISIYGCFILSWFLNASECEPERRQCKKIY